MINSIVYIDVNIKPCTFLCRSDVFYRLAWYDCELCKSV